MNQKKGSIYITETLPKSANIINFVFVIFINLYRKNINPKQFIRD